MNKGFKRAALAAALVVAFVVPASAQYNGSHLVQGCLTRQYVAEHFAETGEFPETLTADDFLRLGFCVATTEAYSETSAIHGGEGWDCIPGDYSLEQVTNDFINWGEADMVHAARFTMLGAWTVAMEEIYCDQPLETLEELDEIRKVVTP